MWWKNTKLMVLLVFVIFVSVFFILFWFSKKKFNEILMNNVYFHSKLIFYFIIAFACGSPSKYCVLLFIVIVCFSFPNNPKFSEKNFFFHLLLLALCIGG